MFLKYMEQEHVCGVLEGLKAEYGTSIATSEAYTEQKYLSLKCYDEKKLHRHLDDLADLRTAPSVT